MHKPTTLLLTAVSLLAVAGCPEEEPPPDPDWPYAEIPLEVHDAYLARQAEYLDYCHASNGPGEGGLYGQLCRVARGDDINLEAIDDAVAKVSAREDTSDFTVAALLRMLYLDDETGALDAGTRTLIEDTVVEFKYWIDEPGHDKMCYWSENHQALFHSNEILAGQLFPDTIFPNSGMTGAEHVAHGEALMERWLDLRGRLGFSEWHSNVYFNEDIPALVNVADLAEDETIRTKAAAALDLLAFDMLNSYYKGYFAVPKGRTYESKFLDGLNDSTTDALWIMTGRAEYASTGNFSATHLATADGYFTPRILEDIAGLTEVSHEHRQRDGFDIADGPTYGVGYEELDDVIIWAGMVAIAAPEVIEAMVEMLDTWDLWDAFLFGDLPPEALGLLELGIANDTLDDLSEDLSPLSRGIALQSMSTYVYRTADYQLAGAQDYWPGTWGAQTQMWQATLDGECYVFTSYPTDISIGDAGMTFATEWTGSWMPRATFHKGVGVIQYRQTPMDLVDAWFTSDHTHAFFPRERFDEVVQDGGWTFGRKGDGYVALYSHNPTEWDKKNPVELVAPGGDNVFLVELGSASESGAFEDWTAAIATAQVDCCAPVRYDSPSVGLVEVGWEGPMTAGGEEVDLGPYLRWDNVHAHTEFGDWVTRIEHEDLRLELDFDGGRRRLLQYADVDG